MTAKADAEHGLASGGRECGEQFQEDDVRMGRQRHAAFPCARHINGGNTKAAHCRQ